MKIKDLMASTWVKDPALSAAPPAKTNKSYAEMEMDKVAAEMEKQKAVSEQARLMQAAITNQMQSSGLWADSAQSINTGGLATSHYFSPEERLRARLNKRYGLIADHFSIYTTPAKVLVWICQRDTNVVLEDDPALFPSDNLVTKINLLIKD